MFGRGFDSRQLHDQAENKHPERGFCFSEYRCKLACIREKEKQKTMRSMVLVFYLQDWNSEGRA
jgi:hypothetical protein